MCGDGAAACAPSIFPSSRDSGEPFNCLICLDLVYKPIVQACGHVFCFWCVRRSMNAKTQSQCPACRRPYLHFPRVCELLHFFLMKAWPEEYTRRSQEVQAMEEEKQIFSSRIELGSPMSSRSPGEPADDVKRIMSNRQFTKTPTVSSAKANYPADLTNCDSSCLLEEACCTGREEANLHRESNGEVQLSTSISVDDFSCASCNKLLYRPVVLNCGEVFCESCLATSKSSCPSCLSSHPGGSIHVFLELHHFLESAFPRCYRERQREVEHLQQQTSDESADGMITDAEISAPADDIDYYGRQYVHIGVGCDGCGMFPIVGHRYHCNDCGELTGYDLCGICHREGSATPQGRFNQQHRPDHRMEDIISDFRAAPLNLNLRNGLISRRRQQQLLDDFDDYIDSFV